MYKHILFATDLLSEHTHLIEKAVLFAKQLRATLYLLHVIELPTSIQLAQGLGFTEIAPLAKDDAQTVLSTLGEALNIPKTHQFVEIGSVREHIFSKAQDLNCQLIIIGSHSTTGFQSILGSTAHAIVNQAPCDVMTLRL